LTLTGTLPVANGGTGVTASTGSGNTVLSTSPTFVTPVLGTPTSGTLTNCTGYPTASLTVDPLARANHTGTQTASTISDLASATVTFTNKSIDEDGTGNAITNIDVPSIKSGSNLLIATIPFIIDGGGSAITTGIKGDVIIDFDCTINSVTMLADQSGSIVVDIWRDSYANFPATDVDSITASAVPTISTATKSQDATLTGWSTSCTAGEHLRFNVDSITTIQRCLISLKVTKVV